LTDQIASWNLKEDKIPAVMGLAAYKDNQKKNWFWKNISTKLVMTG